MVTSLDEILFKVRGISERSAGNILDHGIQGFPFVEALENGIDPIPEDGTVKGGITVGSGIFGSSSLAVGSKFREIQAGQISGDIPRVETLFLRISVNTFFTGLQFKIVRDVRLIRV